MTNKIIERLNRTIFKKNNVAPQWKNSWASHDLLFYVKLYTDNIELYIGDVEIMNWEIEDEFNKLTDKQISRYFIMRLRRSTVNKKLIESIIDDITDNTFSHEYIIKLLNESVSKDAPLTYKSGGYADYNGNGKCRILTSEDDNFCYTHDLIAEIIIEPTDDFDQLIDDIRIKLKASYNKVINQYQNKIQMMIKTRDSL